MKRSTFSALFVLAMCFGTQSAQADWNEFWAKFNRDRCRNEAWPHPFLRADQQSVRQTFGVMVQRGWEQQMVFQSFHFDPNSNELNALGDQKLRWLLSQAPADRAQIFVQQTFDEKTNSARMLAIQTRASEIAANSNHPDIVPSNSNPYLMRGVPAEALTSSVLSASGGVGTVGGGSGGSSGGGSASSSGAGN